MSTAPRTIDLAALLDQRKLTAFNYKLILLSWLITVFDGLDMQMVSYAAPYMRDEFGFDKAALGYIFSAGTFGMVVGGFAFSYLGDRIGRRPTVIISAATFGVLTLATALASSFPALVALRFLDGFAIGGMLPLAWALNIEFVPRRMRATVVAVIMMGYSLGSASAGPLTNLIAPVHGWQGVYLFGGLATLICAACLYFFLPESIRFLVSKGRDSAQVARTLKRMEPALDVGPADHFYLGDEAARTANFHVRDLFAGRLRYLTPIIWAGYFVSSLAIFFGSSWGPIVLEELQINRQSAALVSSFGGLLGALTGMAITRLYEKIGIGVLALIPALAVPVLLSLGLGLLAPAFFLPFVIMQVILVGGGHSAMIAISGVFYPSAIRASGGGWAASMGKMGGVAGPLIGAAVLSSGIPVLRSYALLAICPAILCCCMLGITAVVRGPTSTVEPALAAE